MFYAYGRLDVLFDKSLYNTKSLHCHDHWLCLFLFLSLDQWLALITDCKVPAEETVTETQSQRI